MTRELARELKDAGFPQKGDGRFYTMTESGKPIPSFDVLISVYYPTLTELVEACEPQKADDFSLGTNVGQWEAQIMYHGYFDGWPAIKRDADGFVDVVQTTLYPTPDEAVGYLWLALNKKI